jgi:hypothetical protein
MRSEHRSLQSHAAAMMALAQAARAHNDNNPKEHGNGRPTTATADEPVTAESRDRRDPARDEGPHDDLWPEWRR